MKKEDSLFNGKEDENMTVVSGYYDGNVVRVTEHVRGRKNQRVMITFLDEFLEDRNLSEKSDQENPRESAAKKEAYQALLRLRESSRFPKTIDEKAIMEEAMAEKYGRFD